MWKHYFINSALFYIAGYVCLDITYLSALSFLYLFREKQEDLERCCDILRNDLTLILTMQGMITFLFQIANKRSTYCIDYRHNRLWNSATSKNAEFDPKWCCVMLFSDWRRTEHHTMQEEKLLNILHCLEEKQRELTRWAWWAVRSTSF